MRTSKEPTELVCSRSTCDENWLALVLVNSKIVAVQTLIKLERWLDAVEFCDRALHVDGKCVKAFSRRASAFVRLAVECSGSSEATAAPASAAVDSAEFSTVADRTNEGGAATRGRANITAGDDHIDKALGEAEAGATGTAQAGRKCASHERFGGTEGLMALALLDLDAAVEVDPNGDDIRRQRDALRQEIDEAKVCFHNVSSEGSFSERYRHAPRRISEGSSTVHLLPGFHTSRYPVTRTN